MKRNRSEDGIGLRLRRAALAVMAERGIFAQPRLDYQGAARQIA